MKSFLPLWMMDDSCSRSQQDSLPWTLWLYDELPSFVDDGWFLLPITTGFIPLDFIMIIRRASFLRGWWMILAHHHEWISPGYKYHELPLWMMMNESLLTTVHNSPGYDCHKLLWWMNLTHQQTTTGVLVNQQPPAHYVGWMVCAQKNSFPLYSCINIAIHGPKWTSTH